MKHFLKFKWGIVGNENINVVALVCGSRTNLVGNKRIKHISLRLRNIDVLIEKSGRSPTLERTHSLLVFIYPKVTTWGVPQGVPRFVNGGPHTRARRCPAQVGLGLGDALIF
jgi:hypothetical protein